MASNIKYSGILKQDRLNQFNTVIGASGFLNGYNGSQPATADTALSGNTLLFSLPLSSSFAATASSGLLTANAISTESAANATGTLSWCSLTTSSGGRVCDMSAGTSGADVTVNTTSISSGAQVSCSSFTVTSAG